MKYLSLDLLLLDKGRKHSGTSGGNELGLVILSGRCTFNVGDEEYKRVGSRKNVFTGKASAVYVPPRTSYTIRAERDLEIALCRTKANRRSAPYLVQQDEVRVRTIGRGNWRRKVHDIIYDNVPAQRLVLGETFNPPGNWSSSPPHKHDIHNPPHEALMEEIYFFKVQPGQGFGIQRLYNNRGIDEAYPIANNDAIMIGGGYHPVVAAPGYKLYYLWFLAGKGRKLIPRDDPDHGWLKTGHRRS